MKTKQHFDVLDIFRGIFASMIVFFHLRTYTNTIILNNEFVANASLFVNFFFVLSGFVIAFNYSNLEDGQQFNLFIKKRFYRLYPLHFFLLVIFLIYFLLKKWLVLYANYSFLFANDNWKTFLCSILLIQSIKIQGVNESLSWNYPSWSISAEIIAYIFFGFTELLFHKLRIKEYNYLFYILIILFYIFSFYNKNYLYDVISSYDNGVLYGLVGFYFGVLCAHLFIQYHSFFENLPSILFSSLEIGLILFLPVLVSKASSLLPSVGLWFYNLYFMLTIFFFSFQKGLISKQILKVSILKTIGKYSYSIYMNHLIVILIFNFVLTRLLHFSADYYAVLFVFVYWIVYKFSSWTYHNIEMRFSLKPRQSSLG